MTKFNFFIYGTLKRNKYNHFLLEEIGAEFVGIVETTPNYLLYDGPLPYLCYVYDNNIGSKIKGELYNIPDDKISLLDSFEGHPNYYKRCIIIIKTNGIEKYAFSYLYPYHLARTFPKILDF